MNSHIALRTMCLAIMGCLGITAVAQNTPATLLELAGSLGPEIDGWQLSDEKTTYGPDNLFDYINGGAELYLSYGFAQMLALNYVKEGSVEIKVDIFDMGTPASAYGVFTHSREAVDDFIDPAVESEYCGGLLTFWKGSYYVSILAYPETEEKRHVVKKMAQRISDRIAEEGEKPAILTLLPAKNLDQLSVRYFRHHLWVNSHGFVSQENILQIGPDTEAVLAKYRLPEDKEGASVLLLAAYPDQAGAESAYESYGRHYLGATPEEFKQTEDGLWSGGRVDGRFLSIVFFARSAEQGRALLAKVSERIAQGPRRIKEVRDE